ncbi:acyl-CoA carboxylase epsilon subunit [Streptomyces montanisoli]|uniref:Acyl-CoA carboxylase subunit epsilon n=1 Tax=Streptomyces montanisoli TaxID=2798581 RepID=A0A940RZ30_9ACTN|nr:acyl-CoA carboxylase epsilon subunit [Streptomyces montanisoli]MBP0459833.1 acyl-CoA carboxylase subunit epsilon [Streptomyces montanisoli]
MIKVVRGNPTPEELAAAVAVVQARAATAADAPAAPRPARAEWSSPARIARPRTPCPGPRAWAHTYWPA